MNAKTIWVPVGLGSAIALAFALFEAAGAQGNAEPSSAPEPLVRRVDRAIVRGARYLVSKQHENGSFGEIPGVKEPGEAGITGLALRALAKIPPELRNEFEPAIPKAAQYLLALQQPDGSISNPGTGLTTYRTSIGIVALSAYDPAKYADAIKRGRDFLVRDQWSEEHGLEGPDAARSPYYGGWGYDRSGTRPSADMSNVHFALEALRESGLPPDSPVFKRAAVFLSRCQNFSETNDVQASGIRIGDDGGFMYDPAIDRTKSEPSTRPDGKTEIPSYASMTYAGLMSLLYANVSRDDPRVKAAFGWISRRYTLDENYGLGSRSNPQGGKQGLYYYYHVFAKALAAWGDSEIVTADGKKHRWAEELSVRLVELQKPEGFWVNEVKRWWESEPTLVTSYALLALEIAREVLKQEERGAAPTPVPSPLGPQGEGKGGR